MSLFKGTVEATRSALERFKALGCRTVAGTPLKRLRILGLKPERLREWLAVVDEEFKVIGFREVWHMIRGACFRKVDKRVWFKRQRACYSCPVFDKTLKRCRPYTGAAIGCGCYTPYRLMSPDPCLRETASRAES